MASSEGRTVAFYQQTKWVYQCNNCRATKQIGEKPKNFTNCVCARCGREEVFTYPPPDTEALVTIQNAEEANSNPPQRAIRNWMPSVKGVLEGLIVFLILSLAVWFAAIPGIKSFIKSEIRRQEEQEKSLEAFNEQQ